ncbi:MAG: DEAD/DEAH box helicase [Rikenellaceae bacterium]|nr:DEAD/DEAH box helicase [Rikenellaceae bacterium]
MTNQFQSLGLKDNLIKAITDLGFINPTEVQQRIIPKLLSENNDVVCLAQTGTGKTAAFGLPLLQSIDTKSRDTQALILSPTRELCRQISQDIMNYGKYVENLEVVAVYGGAGIEGQIKALKKGSQIIVATPGRMVDLLNRGVASVGSIHTLILDEADEMLNMGFKDELDSILECTPEDKRTLLFSATLPIEIEGIAKNYMSKPEIVTVGTRNSGSENVKHYYYIVHAKDRYLALKRIADYNPDIYGMIFCRTRQETQEIAESLIKDGYNADALHGELSQAQRDQVMRRFKSKNLSLLVATDVAARGIDVNDLTHVINYNLPDEAEQYTHRSGRTGRADKNGISIAIINSKEQHKIRRIEKIIGKTFGQAKIPTGEEVCTRQILHLVEDVKKAEIREEITEYINLIDEKWKDVSKEEIIWKMLSIEFNRFLDYYRHAPDLNIREESSKGEGRGESSFNLHTERGYTWVKLNIGSKAGITPRHLLRMFSSCGIGQKGVGRIEIHKEMSYVSVTTNASSYIVETIDNTDYRGRTLKVEIVADTKINGGSTEHRGKSEEGRVKSDKVKGKGDEFSRKPGKKSSHGKDSRKPSRRERRRR